MVIHAHFPQLNYDLHVFDIVQPYQSDLVHLCEDLRLLTFLYSFCKLELWFEYFPYIQIGKFNSKLNFYKLIPYLVDRCICPALCRSRQTLEKNVLSWALAGTGSVLFIHQVAV